MKNKKGKNNSFYGKKHTEETKRILSEKAKGRIGYWKGKKLSLETKKKISRNHKNCKGKNNPMYGIHRFGKDSPNYRGGISLKKYSSLFVNIRKTIKRRDNYKCQECGMTELEHKKRLSKSLEIHHIDYNKENNGFFNLITLCRYCNSHVNANRNFWKSYFLKKLINNVDYAEVILKHNKQNKLISYEVI